MTENTYILVVDDDPSLLDLLLETLNTIGYNTIGAENGEEALVKLKDHNFHLVITDIKMPGMDGFTLAEHIHENYPD